MNSRSVEYAEPLDTGERVDGRDALLFMTFDVKDHLTQEETEEGLRTVVKDGIAAQSMVSLTGGIFLVDFALRMGASNFVIGLLAAIPAFAQLLQIPSIYLVEKTRIRRRISYYAAMLARLSLLLIAFSPFVPNRDMMIPAMVAGLALHTSFAAVSQCSWSSWMRDLIPQHRLGSFYSNRMFLSTAVGLVLSLAAAFYIDRVAKGYPQFTLPGYSMLFIVGFAAGMVSVYYISRIPEPRMLNGNGHRPFLKIILEPLAEANFRKLVVFLGSWNFAVNLAAPFFIVYMLKTLGLEMSYVVGLTILSQLMHIGSLRAWGRFTDLMSNKAVLMFSGPLFMVCILAWAFTTMPEPHRFTLPLLIAIHALMGIGMAGVTIASNNIGLKLAGRDIATAYLASISFVNALAAGIAPIIGGLCADFFKEQEFMITFRWASPLHDVAFNTIDFKHWDFFFFFSFVIGLYALHRLKMVEEQGEIRSGITMTVLAIEVVRDLRNFSSVGGLRSMIQFPFYLVKLVAGRKSGDAPGCDGG